MGTITADFKGKTGEITYGEIKLVSFNDTKVNKFRAAARNFKAIFPLDDKISHVAETRVEWLLAGVSEKKQLKLFAEIRPYLYADERSRDEHWPITAACRLLNSGKITVPDLESELVLLLAKVPEKRLKVAEAALFELLKNGKIISPQNVNFAAENLECPGLFAPSGSNDHAHLFAILAVREIGNSEKIVSRIASNPDKMLDLINGCHGMPANSGMLKDALEIVTKWRVSQWKNATKNHDAAEERSRVAGKMVRAFVKLQALPAVQDGEYLPANGKDHMFVRFLKTFQSQQFPLYGAESLNALHGMGQLAAAKILFPADHILPAYVYNDLLAGKEVRLDGEAQEYFARMLVAAACEEKNLSVRDIVEKTLANAKENGVELCFRARCILGTAGLKHDPSAMAAISKIIKGIINGEGASLLEAGAISVMEVIGKSVDGEAILEVVLVGKTPLEALTQVLDDMAKNGGKTD